MKEQVDRLANELLRYLWRQIQSNGDIDDNGIEPLLYRYIPEDSEPSVRLRKAVANRLDAAISFMRQAESEESLQNALFYLDNTVCECDANNPHCRDVCVVDAITVDANGAVRIDPNRCIDCGQCYRACKSGAIVGQSHVLKLSKLLRNRNEHAVYAILAPSFVGQFKGFTYRLFKRYLLAIGFDDVWEVALGADILTVREAEEFCEQWKSGRRFMITSCCCPAFIKLVERHQPSIKNLISNSVSPMIAIGRILKAQDPGCKVVFIGPCLAKRGEINRPEYRSDVDVVLTYKELQDVIMAVHPDIEPVKERNLNIQEASHDGRIYAYSGGVTKAIISALKERLPGQQIKTVRGNGIKECNELLKKIEAGELDAHFMEGMACVGGCVGGPGTISAVDKGEKDVNDFASRAAVVYCHDNKVAHSFWISQQDKVKLFSEDV